MNESRPSVVYVKAPEAKGSERRESVDRGSLRVRIGEAVVEVLGNGWEERRRIASVMVGWKGVPWGE